MSKDDEIRNVGTRRRHILYMVHRYMQDNGLCDTAKTLKTEARLSDDCEVCDNIDLENVYLDYASYYHLRFGKYPKVLRNAKPLLNVEITTGQRKKTKQVTPSKEKKAPPVDVAAIEQHDLQVSVRKIETGNGPPESKTSLVRLQEIEHDNNRTCGGIGDGPFNNQEWQSLADIVKTTILRDDLRLSWMDICGNAKAIQVVKEAVLAPLQYPQLFGKDLRPWKSLLLHGPPGSGKTLLSKILYAETRSRVTFFNVTASVIISKWRGESEKLLRILFQLAQKKEPSIIFFDEIEGFTSKRDRPDHEASKRLKNELLQLMDGMELHCSSVFILASTNLPWEIDEAFLRRFEKKMLVQLPEAQDRARLIGKLLSPAMQITKEQLEVLVHKSENFTGDEIRLACKEITMQAVRERIADKSTKFNHSNTIHAFEQIKPLSVKLMGKHQKWQEEYGS